ncbi:hypothetical protein VTI74DRAFT_5484 [Chaetomium olivicolor]
MARSSFRPNAPMLEWTDETSAQGASPATFWPFKDGMSSFQSSRLRALTPSKGELEQLAHRTRLWSFPVSSAPRGRRVNRDSCSMRKSSGKVPVQTTSASADGSGFLALMDARAVTSPSTIGVGVGGVVARRSYFTVLRLFKNVILSQDAFFKL